ncbi:MAG TPA: type II secretion system protein GspM [Casimicrobiaceae bacterium]|nr:type II secretion system protein GspM [Casimicrobiaceae bacterium]
MNWPRPLADAFASAHPAQRRLWLALSVLVVLVVAGFAALRLQDAIARSREDVVRNRLMLDVARARADENVALGRTNVSAKNGDPRGAIDRVLSANGLRYTALDAQRGDSTQRIVIEAAPFDALVRALDTLARQEGLRVSDATFAARVEHGTVRAELAFTR